MNISLVRWLKISGIFVAAIIIGVICTLPFYWLIFDHFYYEYTDFTRHIEFAKEITFQGKWYVSPAYHIFLSMGGKIMHTSFENAAVVLASLSVLAAGVIAFVIFRRFVPFSSRFQATLATCGFMVISAAVIPSVTTYYIGQGSPNTWHSPTMLLLKPLILLFVVGCISVFQKEKILRTDLIFLGGLLVLSALVKPNFAITAIPAIVIFLLIKKTTLFRFGKIMLIILPTLVILATQFFLMRLPLSSGSIVEPSTTYLTWFSAWKVHSSNIPLSIVLGIAFPFILTLCRFREFKKNIALQFSWILVFVGLLQFAFLAESGVRFYDLNWSWGYNAALVPLFLFCAIELFQWIRSAQQKPLQLKQRLALAFIIILASWHVLSGALYFIHILMRGDPIV